MTAPVNGSYQLEIVGYTAAEFTLTVQITPAGASRDGASEIACVDPGKGVLAAPLLPLDALPSGYHDLTPPDAPPADSHIYLPAVQRALRLSYTGTPIIPAALSIAPAPPAVLRLQSEQGHRASKPDGSRRKQRIDSFIAPAITRSPRDSGERRRHFVRLAHQLTPR